jgi:ATPase family associated with various cellular activities (AAA)
MRSRGSSTLSTLNDPGPQSVDRIDDALRLEGGDAVTVLFGPGTRDEFVCADLQLRTIDAVLLHRLQAAGYQRVAFCTLDGIYFLDAESAAFRPGQPALSETPTERQMPRFTGPRGRQDLLAERPTERVTSSQRTMADPFKIKQLHAYMTSEAIRSAVVVLRAEDFLAHNQASREFAERVGDWLTHGTASRNLAVLVFNASTIEEVTVAVERTRGHGALVAFLRDQQRRRAAGIGLIGRPTQSEMLNLLHRFRLLDGRSPTSWHELPRVASALASRNDPLRDRATQLSRLSPSQPLSVRSLQAAGLIDSAVPDGRSAWERLDELVGLEPVKQHLRRLEVRMRSVRERPVLSEHPPEAPSPHLMFVGNPGTGKTTVARLMAEAFHDIGVLPTNRLHSVEAPQLIGEYVGQTAPLTNAAVDDALGGVLFIDEAYRLSETDRGGFGQEAIDALITRMENDREDFVLIVAGYPAEMETFRNSNPGLQSRIPNVITFPDYTPDELFTITTDMLERLSLTWDGEFQQALHDAVSVMYQNRDVASFGNARSVREFCAAIDRAWSNRVDAPYTQPLALADIPEQFRR